LASIRPALLRIGLVAARRRRARLRRRKTGRRNLRRARADRNEARPGYQRERVGAALRRTAGKAPSGGGRARSRPSGGLWLADDYRLAAVLAAREIPCAQRQLGCRQDRKSTRLNSSHLGISYAVFCLKKKSI